MTTSPIFVDGTGRRARRVQLACWALGLVLGGYVVLVAAALVAPPGTFSLSLPGVGPVLPSTTAPGLTTDDGTDTPATLLTGLPTPSPTPAAPSPEARPDAAASPATSSPRPVGSSTSRPSSAPSALPTAAATPTQRGQGAPTARPTPRGNPRATPSKPARP